MSTGVRIAAFLLGLGLLFALALGAGRLLGPVGAPTAGDTAGDTDGDTDGHTDGGHGAPVSPEAQSESQSESQSGSSPGLPGGLLVSDRGHTLELQQPRAGEAGPGQPVRFQVVGPDGDPLTAYDVEHGKRLHLIAVRRDLAGYQHVHPTMGEDGTWTARLDLSPGTMRLFADFAVTDGPALTLGTDLQVPGTHTPLPVTQPTRVARLGSYRVTLDGAAVAGQETTFTARIERGGEPVTDLQPYLGAFGHLVALREGDLAYLHVHPEEGPAGPEVSFTTTLPSPGRHRLFLDFRHGDAVRTAAFTVVATRDAASGGRTAEPQEDSHDH